MSLVNPFSMHRQAVWRELAGNAVLPLWFRLVCLAYGSHRRNGHANFAPNELANLLGNPASSQISRALRQAKDFGMIAEQSERRCLIVPSHWITGGLGDSGEVCAVHHGKRTGRKPIRTFAPKTLVDYYAPTELTNTPKVRIETTNAHH